MARIDYDWETTTINARRAPSVAIRTLHFDNWTRQFLAVHDAAKSSRRAACGLWSGCPRVPAGSCSGCAVVRHRLPRSHRAARTGIPGPGELSDAAGVGDRPVLAGRDTRRPSRPAPRRGPDHVPDQRRRTGAAASRRRSIPVRGTAVRRVQHLRDSDAGDQCGGAPLGVEAALGRSTGPATSSTPFPGCAFWPGNRCFDSDTFDLVSPAFRWMGRAMAAVPALRTMAQYHRYAFGAPRPGVEVGKC